MPTWTKQSKNTASYKEEVKHGSGLTWEGSSPITWADWSAVTWLELISSTFSNQSKNTPSWSNTSKS